jgi:hypothetical protein
MGRSSRAGASGSGVGSGAVARGSGASSGVGARGLGVEARGAPGLTRSVVSG